MNFVDIEQQRQKQKISVAKLCAAAGVSGSAYCRIRSGSRQARLVTLGKLATGLAAAKRGERATQTYKLFRMVCAQFAYLMDVDIARVLAHDPQMKATSDPKWMEVQQLRAAAIYVMHAVLGVPNVEVARVAGITQAAVTFSVQKFEGRRDNRALDRMLAMIEMAVNAGEKQG